MVLSGGTEPAPPSQSFSAGLLAHRDPSIRRTHCLATIFGAELTLESIDKRTVLADPSGDHLIVLAKSPKG